MRSDSSFTAVVLQFATNWLQSFVLDVLRTLALRKDRLNAGSREQRENFLREFLRSPALRPIELPVWQTGPRVNPGG